LFSHSFREKYFPDLTNVHSETIGLFAERPNIFNRKSQSPNVIFHVLRTEPVFFIFLVPYTKPRLPEAVMFKRQVVKDVYFS